VREAIAELGIALVPGIATPVQELRDFVNLLELVLGGVLPPDLPFKHFLHRLMRGY
jgi:hypothetical protein